MYPFKLHSNGIITISPKNKLFLAETLKAETAVAEPPQIKISLAEAYSFDLLSSQGSPTAR
jgi:hypothetical protein